MTIAVYDEAGKLAGTEDGGSVTPYDRRLKTWLMDGVPSKLGTIRGNKIIDSDSVTSPDDPFFGLALLDRFDDLGWTTEDVGDGPVQNLLLNVFCPTGAGGGVDPRCTRSGFKMPEKPTFVSSQKGNVEANEKAVGEMQQLADLAAAKVDQPVMIDDKVYPNNLEALKAHPATPSPKVQAYKQVLIQAVQQHLASAAPKPGFPDPDKIKVIKDLPGTTGPKLVEDETGKHWVMKDGGPHAENGVDADAAYKAAGINTVKSGMSGGKKFSEYLEGAQELNQWEKGKSAAERGAMYKKIAEGFVADAVFGNRDAVGTGKNNILIYGDEPYRVDNDGSFKYRAQGALKDEAHGGAFGPIPKELSTLLDSGKNKDAADVYGHLTTHEIKQQAKELYAKKDGILEAVKDPDTRAMLGKRFESMKAMLLEEQQPVQKSSSKFTDMDSGVAVKAWAESLPGGKEFLTAVNLKKIANLNPNGTKNGVLVLPKLHTMQHLLKTGQKDLVKKYTQEKNVKFIEFIKQYVPKDVDITQKIIHKSDMEEAEQIQVGTKVGKIEQVGPSGMTMTPMIGHANDLESGVSLKFVHTHLSDDSMEAHEAWTKKLSSDEKSAIWNWKGSSASIRKAVKAATDETTGKINYDKLQETSKMAAAFMSAINKEKPTAGTFYRGISGKYADELIEDIKTKWKAGDVGFVDPCPHNMSLKPGVGNTFSGGKLLLRIKTKNARPTWKEDSHHGEEEVIGYPSTKYKMTRVVENAKVNGKPMALYVDLEEV